MSRKLVTCLARTATNSFLTQTPTIVLHLLCED